MRANVLVSLAFQVVTAGASGKKKTQSFKLACSIGVVSHNNILTTQLVKKGSVIQSPGETYLYHEDSGTLISDVLLWGDSVATSC